MFGTHDSADFHEKTNDILWIICVYDEYNMNTIYILSCNVT